MMDRKHWNELSQRQRAAIVLAAGAQVGLQVAALRDLRRRPATAVKGDKRMWAGLTFVNFAGPIAYFVRGRT